MTGRAARGRPWAARAFGAGDRLGAVMDLKLRLEFDNGLVMGPGKAELLEAIAREGSISAAGRAMGMSYKRAWGLVEEMNAGLSEPVVISLRGGAKGGGAAVTEAGAKLLTRFRALEALVWHDAAGDLRAIFDMSKRK